MKTEQHKSITLTENQASLLPGYELVIPKSVIALSGITMFWQPQMDPNYRKPSAETPLESNESQASDSNVQEKLDRGVIWKQVNERIAELGIPNTKGNRKAIYEQLTRDITTGDIPEGKII